MLHIDQWKICTHHLADLAGIASRRIDHVFCNHAAALCNNLPFPRFSLPDIRHPVMRDNIDPFLARPLGHGIAHARRVHMSIGMGPGTGQDAFYIGIRNQFLYFRRINDVALKPNEFSHTDNPMKPLHFRCLVGKPDASAAMPADILARQFLQPRVQLYPMVMDFCHVVIGDKARALPGSMPG